MTIFLSGFLLYKKYFVNLEILALSCPVPLYTFSILLCIHQISRAYHVLLIPTSLSISVTNDISKNVFSSNSTTWDDSQIKNTIKNIKTQKYDHGTKGNSRRLCTLKRICYMATCAKAFSYDGLILMGIFHVIPLINLDVKQIFNIRFLKDNRHNLINLLCAVFQNLEYSFVRAWRIYSTTILNKHGEKRKLVKRSILKIWWTQNEHFLCYKLFLNT